jgi:hypothetical protein
MEKQPTEEEIDAIYKYIAMTIDEMSDEEQLMWLNILEKLDPEFNLENEDD